MKRSFGLDESLAPTPADLAAQPRATPEVVSQYGLIGAAIEPRGATLQFVSDTAIDVWDLTR